MSNSTKLAGLLLALALPAQAIYFFTATPRTVASLGSCTDTGVVVGNGAAALGCTAAGTQYQPFVANAAGTDPSFQALNLAQAAAVTGILPDANLTANVPLLNVTNTWASSATFSSTVGAAAFAGPLTGNASTASALAANGANCTAGQYPLGVDAAGAAESCSTTPASVYASGTSSTTANQSITANTWTKVMLGSTTVDTASAWSAANQRYVAGTAGRWLACAAAWVEHDVGSGQVLLSIRKNGVEDGVATQGKINGVLSTTLHFSHCATFKLNGTTDYLELWNYNANANATVYSNSVTNSPNRTHLTLLWLGAQ